MTSSGKKYKWCTMTSYWLTYVVKWMTVCGLWLPLSWNYSELFTYLSTCFVLVHLTTIHCTHNHNHLSPIRSQPHCGFHWMPTLTTNCFSLFQLIFSKVCRKQEQWYCIRQTCGFHKNKILRNIWKLMCSNSQDNYSYFQCTQLLELSRRLVDSSPYHWV